MHYGALEAVGMILKTEIPNFREE